MDRRRFSNRGWWGRVYRLEPAEKAAPAKQVQRQADASQKSLRLPPSPVRAGDANDKSRACIKCHVEIVELLKGEEHVADGIYCVVCHGELKAQVNLEVEGALPDRTWRRWLKDDSGFQWRMDNASWEIARFYA